MMVGDSLSIYGPWLSSSLVLPVVNIGQHTPSTFFARINNFFGIMSCGHYPWDNIHIPSLCARITCGLEQSSYIFNVHLCNYV